MVTIPPPKGPVPAWGRRLLAALDPAWAPLDFQILGRILLHALAIGLACGLMGAAFFAGLEWTQKYLLENATGYEMLRAHGEQVVGATEPHPFRPALLLVLPAIGALLGGLVMRLAPETRGGGGDQMIQAFHHQGGVVRRRVIGVKALASILTLGTGGSGGREGPTMQIGAAIGSLVGQLLRVSVRERRLLMVAGVAAGMAAVFRTPLGAALLAVEVLYRDDFEADALIPAILASVTAYSVVISIFGESTLFARAPGYPFHAAHLPLYGLLAVIVALAASAFTATLHGVERLASRLPVPAWARPGVGGLALGILVVPLLVGFGGRLGMPGRGLGLLGGGYGAAQMAITGAPWLPTGWGGVQILLLLAMAKLLASSLTIGTGGSAGDFAPSLVIGGILGGAFGRAAQLLLGDPRLDPGAFALVGMGTFYGGIAHVPLSSLILVSELAGSYDLLVPLMLAEGIAFVALRNRSLYRAQVRTKSESPVHRPTPSQEQLAAVRVGSVMTLPASYVTFAPAAPAAEVAARLSENTWQDAFPVVGPEGRLLGLVTSESIRVLLTEGEPAGWAIAADLMQPAVSFRPDDDLQHAAQVLVESGLREAPVVDPGGAIVGFLEEEAVIRAYVAASRTSR
jgi:chloride channel protein, CIC family